jgi:hypothetical protein
VHFQLGMSGKKQGRALCGNPYPMGIERSDTD